MHKCALQKIKFLVVFIHIISWPVDFVVPRRVDKPVKPLII